MENSRTIHDGGTNTSASRSSLQFFSAARRPISSSALATSRQPISKYRVDQVAEVDEVLFVVRIEHPDRRHLEDFVLHRCNAQRPLPSVGLVNPCPLRGLRPMAVTGDLPVLEFGVSAHARFLDSARSGGHCLSAYPARIAFPVLRHGRQLGDACEARWLAYAHPCQRFDRLLAEPAA
jgi:hypothetical protein